MLCLFYRTPKPHVFVVYIVPFGSPILRFHLKFGNNIDFSRMKRLFEYTHFCEMFIVGVSAETANN